MFLFLPTVAVIVPFDLGRGTSWPLGALQWTGHPMPDSRERGQDDALNEDGPIP